MRPFERPVDGQDNIKMDLIVHGQFLMCSYDSGWGQVAGCFEQGYEPSGYIKCREFLGQLKIIISQEQSTTRI
jgi:hypothetical protein